MGYIAAVFFALFVWWFATGAILCLGRRDGSTFGNAMTVMTAIATMALYGLYESAGVATAAGAYIAFSCALLVWAWHEMSFLFGHVTGPRKAPCPPGLAGWARFKVAFQTISHHEYAILATALFVLAITWGEPNQIGTHTFLILWVMRISAKLNVFLGAPHVADSMMPPRLAYLKTYFRRDRLSPFFALSVTASTMVLGLAIHISAVAPDAFTATGATLLATMLGLAVLEHWFMALPVADAALWRWATPKGPEDETGAVPSPVEMPQPIEAFHGDLPDKIVVLRPTLGPNDASSPELPVRGLTTG